MRSVAIFQIGRAAQGKHASRGLPTGNRNAHPSSKKFRRNCADVDDRGTLDCAILYLATPKHIPTLTRVFGHPSCTMAATATHATTYSILSSFLPRLAPSTASATSRSATLYSRQLSHPFLPRLAIGIPSAISLNIPGLIEGIWESILKAVPKKKTSHMKKRHRQMAGKGLKDVTSLNRCSSCGAIKRAHLLCPVCLDGTCFASL